MDHEINSSEAITKIWDLIRDVKIAMLTTAGPQGVIRSRPMATQENALDGHLWFLASRQSGMVDEIEQGSQVGLSYVNSESHAFISLSGHAELTSDRDRIQRLWKPQHAAWFPQGKDDPDIVVLKVIAEEAEYWEAPGNALVRSFRFLQAAMTNDSSKIGEHEKVSL